VAELLHDGHGCVFEGRSGVWSAAGSGWLQTIVNIARGSRSFSSGPDETNREKLLGMMAGGEELERLAVELDLIAKRDTGPVSALEHHAAEDLGLKDKK